jgi:hypothetical protein
MLVTGDRTGCVKVWQVAPVTAKDGATASLTACAEFTISGYNVSAPVEGGLNLSAMGATTGAAKTAAAASKGKGKDARPTSAPVKKSAPARSPSFD